MVIELVLSVVLRSLVYTYGVPMLRAEEHLAERRPQFLEMLPWSLLFGGLANLCVVLNGIPLVGLLGSFAWLAYLALFIYVFAFRWQVGIKAALKLAGVEVAVLFVLRFIFLFV